MGTKSEPGRYDCYAMAEPDEPMFILLGRDVAAPAIIREWVARRIKAGNLSTLQGNEAIATAKAMEEWRARRRDDLSPLDD